MWVINVQEKVKFTASRGAKIFFFHDVNPNMIRDMFVKLQNKLINRSFAVEIKYEIGESTQDNVVHYDFQKTDEKENI